jgi:RNA-binding protein YlmH
LSKIKPKRQSEDLWLKQRQKSKHILYFDFVYNRQLDILLATFFGGTLANARIMVSEKEILVNGQVVSKSKSFINFGDFIQIAPTAYLTILKYKHYLLGWKKNQYRGYLLSINLLGLQFNRSLNNGVIAHFKF